VIGILDSGLAGLHLLGRLMADLPDHSFVYFGDTARGPCGDRSPERILRCARRGLRFLEDRGAERIVLACHATSAAAGPALSAEAGVSVLDVVEAAAAAALRATRGGRIGVMGDRATIRSGAYVDRIRALSPDAVVHQAPCPLVGALVDEGWVKKPETAMIVKKHLIPLKARKIDTLVLGNARYPLLGGIIQRKIGRRVALVEASAGLAQQLSEAPGAATRETASDARAAVYLSDITPETGRRAAVFLRRRVRFEPVAL
jgi:glutamate racemase